MKIGVLALQGAFREHKRALNSLGIDVVEVRKPEHLQELAGIIIPGGESTTIGKLLVDFGIKEELVALGQKGFPIFGTCAGLIILSKELVGRVQPGLGLMDITTKRNAFGRQVDSFEYDLEVPVLGPKPIKAVFIRAPYIEQAGPDVKILASFQGKPVLARQGNLLVAAFHPELTADNRLHQYFVEICQAYQNQS